MERGMRSRSGFLMGTFLLVLVSAFCVTGTVISQSRIGERELENYYREQERQLVRDTRAFLEEAGYRNSGVMLTKVMEADGSRVYTLTVHHGRIDAMEDQARETLREELSAYDFPAENCTFCHEFLIID